MNSVYNKSNLHVRNETEYHYLPLLKHITEQKLYMKYIKTVSRYNPNDISDYSVHMTRKKANNEPLYLLHVFCYPFFKRNP